MGDLILSISDVSGNKLELYRNAAVPLAPDRLVLRAPTPSGLKRLWGWGQTPSKFFITRSSARVPAAVIGGKARETEPPEILDLEQAAP